MKKTLRVLAYLLLLLLLLPIGGLIFLRAYFNDGSVPTDYELVPPGHPKRVLVVFPHPDDEITLAGTVCRLKAEGFETSVVYLTQGEAGSTGGLTERSQLGETRSLEAREAARILGFDRFAIHGFPDSGLENVSLDTLKQVVLDEINSFRPSVVFTFDDKVGLYGHPDHRATARAVFELVRGQQGQTGFPVRRVYGVTLPPGMIKAAMKVSATFAARYPKEPGAGLPAPDFAVTATPFGQQKHGAVKAHKTQWQVLGDLQPLNGLIPPKIYYWVFAKEYFYTAVDLDVPG